MDVKIQLLEEKLMNKIYKLEADYRDVKDSLDKSEVEREKLSERVLELESIVVITKAHKQLFKDNVCMELMSCNVSMKQVEPAVKSVLHNVTNLEINELPKMSTLVSMLPEMKALAYKQVGEELTKCNNLTLHSDGASKFGQHYQGFQVSASSGSYSLGLSEILTGSADIALQTHELDINLAASDGTGQMYWHTLKIQCQIVI